MHTVAAILRLETALKAIEEQLPPCRQEAASWAAMEREAGRPHFGTAPMCSKCGKSLAECLGWSPLPGA